MKLLQGLIEAGHVRKNDADMADKGFTIDSDLQAIGIKLNIPPFTSSAYQMSKSDTELTHKIAKHRIHIERLIRKVKKYKIVSGRIPTTMFNTINQIWTVCCFLTLFDDVFVT